MDAIASKKPLPVDRKAPDLGQVEFQQIQKLIARLSGLNLTAQKKSLVSGRLLKRLRALDCATFQGYIDIVENPVNAAERNVFVDLLTTHETHFFREAPHFEMLGRFATERATRLSHPVRFWSAACSSGEEAFSAAMVLDSACGQTGYEILATDVSDGTLNIARRAHFPIQAAATIPDRHLKLYCERGVGGMSGTFRIKKSLADRITFSQMNLLEPWNMKRPFDVIFLRNVMIYFDFETKRSLIERMKLLLVPGGLLVVGHAESLNGLVSDLDRIGQSVYAKNVAKGSTR